MEFQWTYDKRNNTTSEIFLKEQGVSKGLLAKVKFQGGKIQVNGTVQKCHLSFTNWRCR